MNTFDRLAQEYQTAEALNVYQDIYRATGKKQAARAGMIAKYPKVAHLFKLANVYRKDEHASDSLHAFASLFASQMGGIAYRARLDANGAAPRRLPAPPAPKAADNGDKTANPTSDVLAALPRLGLRVGDILYLGNLEVWAAITKTTAGAWSYAFGRAKSVDEAGYTFEVLNSRAANFAVLVTGVPDAPPQPDPRVIELRQQQEQLMLQLDSIKAALGDLK